MSASVADLEQLEEQVRRSPARVVPPGVLIRVLALLRHLLQQVERGRTLLERGSDEVRERLSALDDRLGPIESRLLIVDALPASAPFGALIRLRTGTLAERSALYLGNGPTQPLSKLTPTPL